VAHGDEGADAQRERLVLIFASGHLLTLVELPAITTSAFAGSLSLALGYAAARRIGLTDVDLAGRLLPGRPVLGRAAQLAIGTAACLPAARLATPLRGLLAGAAAGAVAATTQRRARDRVLAITLHAIAGAKAGSISRAARARH
jgi:hypothetical protein